MDRRLATLCHALFPALLLVVGLVAAPPGEIACGLGAIVTSPSVLLHDYLAIGGTAATLVNAGLCGAISLLLLAWLRIPLGGPFIAAVYTVIGFSFFGKNVLNIWPIFAGVALFARYQRLPFKNYALVALFGTTLAPLVSMIAFGTHLNGVAALATGIGFGLLAGFILPPLASHMLRFHDGYNIYNIGFTGGIVGAFLTAVLRSFNFMVSPASILSERSDRLVIGLLLTFFALLVPVGLAIDRWAGGRTMRASLKAILGSSGRLVSDFTRIGDHAAVLVNMGVMGLLASLFVILLGGVFNGPAIGGILTVVGFAAFGKHPRNCLPVLAGVFLASLLKVWETGSTAMVIAGLFGTTLAPIAGQYGAVAGVLAGFFHLSVVMNVGMLHGGINLYNNGFAGGFVASFLAPLIDALKREKKP